jgi:hypothetical protein
MNPNPDYVGIFAYGSLVNRRTHTRNAIVDPFRIRGWRRSWGHCMETPSGRVCALTITPSSDGEVAGIVIRRYRLLLPRLDKREQQYKRIRLSLDDSDISSLNKLGKVDVFTYTSEPPFFRTGDHEFPIWRSYVECVLAGFINIGGYGAAQEFIESTRGWKAPILDDSRARRYRPGYRISTKVQLVIENLIRDNDLNLNQFRVE